MTCIFIASKYTDKKHIQISKITHALGQDRVEEKAILEKEVEILQTIGFKVGMVTVYTLANVKLVERLR